jgi:peptidoglycan/LPS O-acetylase OafA/YrhL
MAWWMPALKKTSAVLESKDCHTGPSMKEETQRTEHASDETVRTRPGKRTGYIASLDGWRAVAIFWVLDGHSPLWHVGRISDHWLHTTGDRGVGLFFALSGFLICTRLLREERQFGCVSLRSFYTRRLFRIQPAALTYLAVVSLLMFFGAIPKAWSAVVGAALMIRNFFPARVPNWDTVHFWSLAVEEHFYLFLPGFLVLCKRYRLAIMSALVVAFEVWRVIVLHTPKLKGFTLLIFFRTDVVIGGLFLGCVFALALMRPNLLALATTYLRPWLALLYTAIVFARLELHHSNSDNALLITVYPILIAATALHPTSLTTRFLELAAVRFIGRISYSLYLWQELFFNYFVAPTPHTFRSHVFLCWCAVFACAIVSYYLIETPMIRYGHRIAKRFDVQPAQDLHTLAV